MSDTLVLVTVQPEAVAGDVAANVERHAAMIDGVRPGAVAVFPELSLTGYHLDAPALRRPVLGGTEAPFEPLVTACRRRGATALVGAPTADPSTSAEHISMLRVDGRGVEVVYDKWFLGADEASRFTPGSGPAVLDVGGWRLGLAICRDTGVADHARATAGRGIDVYVAGVCEHDHDHPVIVDRVRRITADHGVAVAVASFAGSTGEGYDPAAGRSGVWGPDGTELARAGPDPGHAVEATLRRDGS